MVIFTGNPMSSGQINNILVLVSGASKSPFKSLNGVQHLPDIIFSSTEIGSIVVEVTETNVVVTISSKAIVYVSFFNLKNFYLRMRIQFLEDSKIVDEQIYSQQQC